MCVNDILAQGAEPLFFLDYFSCGKLDLSTTEAVIAGVSEACKEAGCALLGTVILTTGLPPYCILILYTNVIGASMASVRTLVSHGE